MKEKEKHFGSSIDDAFAPSFPLFLLLLFVFPRGGLKYERIPFQSLVQRLPTEMTKCTNCDVSHLRAPPHPTDRLSFLAVQVLIIDFGPSPQQYDALK